MHQFKTICSRQLARELTTKLGAWLPNAQPQTSPRWKSFFEHSTQHLFLPADQPHTYYQVSTHTHLEFSLARYNLRGPKQRVKAAELPKEAIPVQPTTDGGSSCVNRLTTPVIRSSHPAILPTSFQDYIDALDMWKRELLQGISQTTDFDTLSRHLRQGDQLWLCSDGGAKRNTGSFGWVIATSTIMLWECIGMATGWYANSFRSESVGQLALLVFLETFLDYYQLHDIAIPAFPESAPWLRITKDNQGLIDRIKSGLATKTMFAGAGLSPEYDVVHDILETTRRLPIPLTWEHVKGHQDKKRKWYKLTWMETLNVRADKHATSGLAQVSDPARTICMIPSSKVTLRIHNTDITSQYATHLRKAATCPAMLQRAHKHYGWIPAQFEMIDWKAHHDALRKLRFNEKKFVTKFIHQSLPMGKVFHKIDPSQAMTCSSCKVKT
jgi:hypothetical protein